MKSGIYRIIYLPKNKLYIGSAINLDKRFLDHKSRLRTGKHYNRKLQNAWNKYGEDNFKFEIIELVNEDDLITREQYWIDITNACCDGFNLAQKAGAGGSCKEWIITHPDGTEELVVNMNKFARKHKLNAGALSQVAMGNVNQHKQFKIRYSDQSSTDWQKTSYRSTKFGHGWKGKYVVITPSGEEITIDSLNEFCGTHKLSQGNMAAVCRGERKQHKGYSVKYLTSLQEDI